MRLRQIELTAAQERRRIETELKILMQAASRLEGIAVWKNKPTPTFETGRLKRERPELHAEYTKITITRPFEVRWSARRPRRSHGSRLVPVPLSGELLVEDGLGVAQDFRPVRRLRLNFEVVVHEAEDVLDEDVRRRKVRAFEVEGAEANRERGVDVGVVATLDVVGAGAVELPADHGLGDRIVGWKDPALVPLRVDSAHGEQRTRQVTRR